MPIALSQIANNTAQVSFPFSGDTVTITYYPSRVTERFFAISQMANNTDVMDGFKELNAQLVGVMKDWDVYASPEDIESGQTFPLDADRFSELPIDLRMQSYGAIMTAIGPEGTASQAKISS